MEGRRRSRAKEQWSTDVQEDVVNMRKELRRN